MATAGHVAYNLFGGLKFVRWDYTARNSTELTVQKGDEVKVLTGPGTTKEKYCKVKSEAGSGRAGFVPLKCFAPRKIIQWSHDTEYEGEVSVNKGETVGEMEKNAGDPDEMCRVFKSKIIGGEEGLIPQNCFYPRYEVYRDHKHQNSDELDVTKGDEAGLVDKDNFDVYWKVYYKGRIGLVPSSCFEHPTQVEWDYEEKKDDEISVKQGDIVTMVDHDGPNTGARVKVRLDSKVGYIPRWCFERRAEVFFDNEDPGPKGIYVKRGNIVGIVEERHDGFLKVRFNKEVGLVPKKCFEIPARVIKNYQKVKPNELTVNLGDEVRVMDATAYIQVRLGDRKGEVPLKCINVDVKQIVSMLQKKDDHDQEEDHIMHDHEEESGSQDNKPQGHSSEAKAVVDENALNRTLGIADKSLAVDYLKSLNFDEIGAIGMALGLSFATLRALSADNYHDEMVKAWLARKDDVATTGTPTWKLLGAELQKMRKSDIADRITKDNTQLEPAKLLHMEWHDNQQQRHELRIVNEVSNKWRKIGTMLSMKAAVLDAEQQRSSDNSMRFQQVIEKWIEMGTAGNYPATWRGLQQVLIDVEMAQLANRIKLALPFCQ